MSDFEQEREANIARNRALLAELDLTLDIPKKPQVKEKPKAKPVQPANKRKREPAPVAPLRQSTRLRRTAPDPNETPEKKRKREQEEERLRQKQEQERLEQEEREREAKRPRHEALEMYALLEDQEANEVKALTSTLQVVMKNANPRRVGDNKAHQYDEDSDKTTVKDLKKKFQKLKIVSRAKVNGDRVYSSAYHPEVSKDLIFFGDKHGELGIWDARAPAEEVEEDGDVKTVGDDEGGRYWRMQLHWPATSRSSISCIKFDPIDGHSVFTSSYDQTLRQTSFVSGISQEVFAHESQICSFDILPHGHEVWVSDVDGGVTHLDLREDKSKARWYQLSDKKIGCVSVNPVNTNYLLTASNSKALRVWDVRKFANIAVADTGPVEVDFEQITQHIESKVGKSLMRGEWRHGQSTTAAYWDPNGRRIVSTSYDNSIKMWDISPDFLKREAQFPTFRPAYQFAHNCQTGKWVTLLRAQWSPNPDVYPHFTIGNMDHSLEIRSWKGELLAKLADKTKITAVQAVTCSHPSITERAASGNASGRCVLWAPDDL